MYMYKYLTIASVLANISAPALAEVTVKSNTDSTSRTTEIFNKELDSNNDGSISSDERLNSNSVSVESDTENNTTTQDGSRTRQFHGNGVGATGKTDTGINAGANVGGIKAGVGGGVSTGILGGTK